MTDISKHILRHLHSVHTMQEIAEKAGLLSTISAVQSWQCQRLLLSHQAIYQQKNYQVALDFFVHELYGPKNFSQRDQDIIRVVPKMALLLPVSALQSLASALELNALTYELDFALAKQLKDQALDDIIINRETYLAAYRACNNANMRQQQIHLIEVMGKDLAQAVNIRGVSSLLMLSRKPAKIAGVYTLHQFIDSGYKAFKPISNVDDFILPIVHFEQGLKDQMFDLNMPNPLPTLLA
ncbi:FFLEELY motif protein [Paraglaciecola hydrolytica]|uniref:DUF8198 domain-containing protein n=1 Tax=Paraglaciecola hydrolytica TaxID=1799789 RepID=A0A136A2F6_9ALTE|nr:hypothetical protein [Paraglaciecola hydrolytica]KXI29429.1 hypothetical protein AX660_14975 [Paraglaciecola hydrolytica]